MSKPASKSTERRMEFVEIVQVEEMPVLTAEQNAELLASLETARQQVRSGDCLMLTQEEIGPWLRAGLEKARHNLVDSGSELRSV